MNTQQGEEQSIKERSVDQLINSILTRVNHVANFALLLGSGASSTSHVKTADEMIDDWRHQLYNRSDKRIDFESWLKKQEWYSSDDEYGRLFKLVYGPAAIRRNHIEECLKDARPYWGYVYLTNLLKDNVFNVVFTTNFDDLINEACYLYSDVRPVLCAHDSDVSGIRVTLARPKIIKLHGDFLFDDIDTAGERLKDNMKEKFTQFAREYGLVVIGYSGRDSSVMDILRDLVQQKGEYFKQGIYWCEREGQRKRGRQLSSLLRGDNVYLVKIADFDEFMAELNRKANLPLPEQVADPLWVAKDRAHLFVDFPDLPGPIKRSKIIFEDTRKVLSSVSHIKSSVEVAGDRLPPLLRAAALRQERKPENELEELERAYKEDPDDTFIAWEKANVLAKLHRQDELRKFIYDRPMGKDPVWDGSKAYFLLRTNDNKGAIAIADEVLTSRPRDYLARINRAIALKRLRRLVEMEKELFILEGLELRENVRAGIAALRGRKDEMLSLLEMALDKDLITSEQIEMFVVFEDYWEDNDLRDLVARKRHNGLDKDEAV